ncbi:glycosyltransferase [Carboxylicivirga marina]|uniref:Glycosyltransferase n=1 Tax=Carboxylicivirga marina TaxID=2800988 RepID=A0ABS1HLI4_9BACT|nr:glycosyltransferase [Carboxylicivirga marina]MBK3518014.1 glycosyltransferase [Carboxylicivirga marina]
MSKVKEALERYNRKLILGPYPPPLGGVSVYIYRLNKLLLNTHVSDFSKSNYLGVLRDVLFRKYDVIHLNTNDVRIFILLILVKRFWQFDIFLTSHNPRLFDTKSKLKIYVIKKFFKSVDCLCVVGQHILDSYKQQKVTLPKEIIIEPAFVPPPLDEEKKIISTYPKELNDFINSHSPVLVANAFRVVLINDVDLYGLDLCVDLMTKIINERPNIGFVFAIADEMTNASYLDKIRDKIYESNLEKNFYFLTGQKELWPLFKKADLMIRPTASDGYGVSIAEALFFDCHSIASDVCDRPNGTIIFKNRDIEDLYNKTKMVLDKNV